MRLIILIFLSAVFLSLYTLGQGTPSNPVNEKKTFPLGVIENIESVELTETRTLNIYLPEGYSPDSSATYPVIYLLDGSANEDFIHIVGIVQFLNMIERMPKSIVVGIANVDRRRDFTFPTTVVQDKKDYPTTGGSEKFIAFIEKELQPFIQKKYKTNGFKTIIGQSLGGLLATEVLLKKPTLFNQYLIVSPSLWWDHESILPLAPKLLEKQPDQTINAYVAVGNEEKQMQDNANQFVEILKRSGKKHLQVNFLLLPDEDHLTILHNSIYKGFEVLYPPKPDHKN